MRTAGGPAVSAVGLDPPRGSEAGLQQTFPGSPGQVHRPDARATLDISGSAWIMTRRAPRTLGPSFWNSLPSEAWPCLLPIKTGRTPSGPGVLCINREQVPLKKDLDSSSTIPVGPPDG